MTYVREVLLDLLHTPSPSGRTDVVMQMIGDRLTEMGVDFHVTRRGVLVATLPGTQKDGPDRALAVHADTIGCMVKELKDNGRLKVAMVGTFSARFAEGAHVTIFVDDISKTYTGQILPLKASGHTYGDEVDVQGVGWDLVEVRVDEPADTKAELEALGIQVGDFVALDALPVITPNGYIKSRHLDDKAGVAAVLGCIKAILDAKVDLPVSADILITIGEEVGMGATHGLDSDVSEFVAIDNAVVAPGQQSREEAANVGMMDSTGPFDYHLTRKLVSLAKQHDIPVRRDVFKHYRSDAAPAVEAGLESRTAVVGFGVDSSHGHERTHLDGVQHLAELLAVYLQSDLTFSDWDQSKKGALEDFPSHSVQPAGEPLLPQ